MEVINSGSQSVTESANQFSAFWIVADVAIMVDPFPADGAGSERGKVPNSLNILHLMFS